MHHDQQAYFLTLKDKVWIFQKIEHEIFSNILFQSQRIIVHLSFKKTHSAFFNVALERRCLKESYATSIL